jgi:flagellar biosynthetic protein FliS
MSGARDGYGALAAYRTVAGIDASPEELMRMALEAAMRLLTQAATAIADGDRPQKALALSAVAKIVEFLLGLSGSTPGPLSGRLADLYRFALAAILSANAKDDGEAVAAARFALQEIAGLWHRRFSDTAMLSAAAE